MLFNITIAKNLFRWDIDKEAEIDTALTNAMIPAKNLFKSKIGQSEYKRYINTTHPITIISIDSDNITVNYNDSITKVRIGDFITLDSLMFEVLTVGSGYFTIDNKYNGSQTAFTIDTMISYEVVFALCVIYWFTNTAQELNLDIILDVSTQFGSATAIPAYDPIKAYKTAKLKEIDSMLAPIKLNLGSNIIEPIRR